MQHDKLQKYAHLLIKVGINIQKDQTLVINTPIEGAEFARLLAEVAYKEGAREVVLNWRDEKSTLIKYLHAPVDLFDEYPDWQKEYYLSYARKGAAFLSISASDPELMKDVDPQRMVRAQRAANKAIKEYSDRLMANKNVWCVASIPTLAWAKKVFPNVSGDEAVNLLWDAIFNAVRANHDSPVEAWEHHKNNLKKRMEFLNSHNFDYLHFTNSLGTDLKLELPEGHVWLGGSEFSPEGTEFNANIPTEEVFTLPKKTGVNGVVYSSKPLNYGGNLVDEFHFTFKDGKVVDFFAKQGQDALESLLNIDEGARYLGEVALVPFNSPISQSNILFYNTLFDENASCHLALGRAYPTCIKGGGDMDDETLEKRGVNYSMTHVDFMFGTEDLKIVGVTKDGKKVDVFENGNFVSNAS